MSSKKSILFVPAWYPCSFFEEQQSVYAGEYDIYNVVGNCLWLPKRMQLKRLLSLKRLSDVAVTRNGTLCNIEISCPKYKSQHKTAKAIRRMSDKVGNVILSLMDGRLPEYVYIQSISDFAVFVAEWAKHNGIKIILAEHILYIRHSIDYITHRKEQLYREADKVFCVSNYLYRNLLTSGFRMKSVSVVGNLVSDCGVPENWENINKNGRIMFVASHVHDKDMPTLFAVAKRLPSQLAIDVFGLTDEETLDGKQLREYAGENIVFKGKMPHNDLLMQYSAYSLLLSTSVSETFGLSVAEAIAHGTPVVCTDSGGIRDFVNEGNGLVVDIRDVDGIVDAIVKVISAQIDSKNMSQRILEKYGSEQYVNCADLLR